MSSKLIAPFTQQYAQSKTLRFELKPCDPQGREAREGAPQTKALQSIIAEDRQRAQYYQQVKDLIDDYLRDFIERTLATTVGKKAAGSPDLIHAGKEGLQATDLIDAWQKYRPLYKQIPPEARKSAIDLWKKHLTVLRKKLTACFWNTDPEIKETKVLFKKDLVEKKLPDFLKKRGDWEKNQQAVESFRGFTTYFVEFFENRKNMFVDKAQTTAIANRVCNENLVRFFNSLLHFEQIKKTFPELYQPFCQEANPQALEKLHCTKIDQVFSPDRYLLLLSQAGIDAFNTLLGRSAENPKEQGINQSRNLYLQKLTKEGDPDKKLPLLKKLLFQPLHKQILSESNRPNWIQSIDSNPAFLAAFKGFKEQFGTQWHPALKQSLSKIQTADPLTIWLRGDRLQPLSRTLFKDRFHLKNALEFSIRDSEGLTKQAHLKENPNLKKKSLEKWEQKALESLEQDDGAPQSIGRLDQLLNDYHRQNPSSLDPESPTNKAFTENPLQLHFSTSLGNRLDQSLEKLEKLWQSLRPLENRSEEDLPKNTGKDALPIKEIKDTLDDCLYLSRELAYLHLLKKGTPIEVPENNLDFYQSFDEAFSPYNDALQTLYNQTRNYLSKKPYSSEKLKINFEKATFLDGWDVNKENDHRGVILQRKGSYYLAILRKEKSITPDSLFVEPPSAKKHPDAYEKMYYKQVTGANKMLPKNFFGEKGRRQYQPPAAIIRIYENKEYVLGDNFKLESCHQLIDFYKKHLPTYKSKPTDRYGWEVFNFKFSPTSTYQNIDQFFQEFEQQSYRIWFRPIDPQTVVQAVQKGDLFLFQIYNKDFSPYSKGRPNLHTLYWRSLFLEENWQKPIVKLNGKAEVFFRPRSLEAKKQPTHPPGQALENKNPHNPKRQSTFAYPLIKDKRYTADKFFLHLPITLNPLQKTKGKGETKAFNLQVNQALGESPHSHIIGIDRGERNLLAYTVIDPSGTIVEQGDLNQIHTDQGYPVDYHQKLDKIEKQRDQARKSWETIDHIKELKAGYLSHVIHRLARMVVQYDAILCLENLQYGFKRGRFKVEKQVYHKFEKALIDKFNHLVFKEAPAGQPGHFLNALQLTLPCPTLQDIQRQNGILFYVRAAYTSKICPATGFVNFLDLRYQSLQQSIQFFEQIQDFRYCPKYQRFELDFDYCKIKPFTRGWHGGGQSEWRLGTHGTLRYRSQAHKKTQKRESIPVDSTAQLKQLLEDGGIPYKDTDLCKKIVQFGKNPASPRRSWFFKNLFYELKTAFSLRHSKVGSAEDFILSPVISEDGSYFDSRQNHPAYPANADQNGAYHIALKGLWYLRSFQKKPPTRPIETLKDVDWVPFAQEVAKTRRP